MPEDRENGTTLSDRGARWFATTHWSVVLAAKDGESPLATEALEQLCRTYWPPMFAYIRRDGYGAEDAEDLTQEFLARLIERHYLDRAERPAGKFRSFLLAYLKHFLQEKRARARALKRGGGREIVPLHAGDGEPGYLLEAVDHLTPDEIFERRWAQALMQRTFQRLQQEYVEAGKETLYEQLRGFQPRENDGDSYAQMAARLGRTEAAVKSAMQRLRRRHRELLREEMAHTVRTVEEIDEELRYLHNVLSRGPA